MSFVEPQPVEPKAKKQPKVPKTKPVDGQASVVDPIEQYQDITLSFGKYAGRQLKDVANEDVKYLKWIKTRFEKDENASPTMKAIVKFANALTV
jgi:hypothetical protein